jgi:hypothetical protein
LTSLTQTSIADFAEFVGILKKSFTAVRIADPTNPLIAAGLGGGGFYGYSIDESSLQNPGMNGGL